MHAALLAAEAAEVAHELPMPPIGFGIIGFGTLMVLLAATYAFRSVGTRH